MSTISQLYGDLTKDEDGIFVDTKKATRSRESQAKFQLKEKQGKRYYDQRWYEKLERVKRMAKHG